MRNSRIAPPAEGQFRLWVTMQELRRLLSGRFECLRFGTVEPGGNRGLLRVVNSVKVTSFLSRIFSKERVVRAKERLGLEQDTAHAGPKTPLMPVERGSLRPCTP
jgi:hypothetical protein